MVRRSRALACAVLLSCLPPAAASACDRKSFVVLLDVGHTPAAPGAISARGKTEYAFNLALAAAVETALKARGYAKTARLGAAAAALRASRRGAAIGKAHADLMLSIHHDSVQKRYLETWVFKGETRAYSDRFKGWSIFVSQAGPGAAGSLKFGRGLADALLARGWPFSRHHAESIPGEGRALIDAARGIYRRDELAVLRSSPAPAALLEAGVIVNRDEEAALDTRARRSAIAAAVADAVDAYCVG